ncbi:hypothetical protein QPM17_01405 [Marinobacter sp. TBZ242]|uniref:Glycosyl transferase family 2 n=1 Tax=Marinobacter azerbaijanicus TaxID=3050455 RepID=A0ABT7I6L3_9GAMM|nr:hypothetical protein [Marinobacter sp. TBZ242]MDL0429767.1 hypothetical protein [Marinobacter sp. TBZ242]
MTTDTANQLTIACICIVGGAALENSVRSILATGLRSVIVADPGAITPKARDIIRDHCIEWIDSSGCSVPAKRALATNHCTSEWIAFIEDTCTVDDSWRSGCEAVMEIKDAAGASGPVRLGSPLDRRARALYCSDYGSFFPAALHGRRESKGKSVLLANTLPGVNLLYRRALVMSYMNGDGLIESEINPRIRGDGHGLYIHENLSVTLRNADSAGTSFLSRFNHGRLYGGLQARNLTVSSRLVRALACVLLPFVLSLRSLKALAYTREQVATTALWIVMFETVWSVGECTGYLLGSGNTLADWQ